MPWISIVNGDAGLTKLVSAIPSAPLRWRRRATALSSTAWPVTRPYSAETLSGIPPRKSRVRYSG